MKAVFFDIDGTIWDNKMRIPQSAIDGIRRLRANGHLAFINSGRAKSNILDENLSVCINEDGSGDFTVNGGSAAVYVEAHMLDEIKKMAAAFEQGTQPYFPW